MRPLVASSCALAAGAFLAGCSAAPEPVHTQEVLTTSTAASTADGRRATTSGIGVAMALRPRQLVIDGAFAEWGALPSLEKSLAPPTLRTQDGSLAAYDNPLDATSRVFAAVDREGVALAIELTGMDEAWVGIGSTPAELPALGQYFGRMGFVPTSCTSSPRVSQEEGSDEQGYWMEENPPEVVAACEKLLARAAEQQMAHNQRFERWFHVSAKGVEMLDASGAPVALSDAKLASRRTGPVLALEVALPLSALPRFAEAPVTTLRLAASSKPPASMRPGPGVWAWFAPAKPITFDPLGELLVHAFKRTNDVGDDQMFSTQFKQPRGLSYHPSNTNALELFDSKLCEERSSRDVRLYSPLATEPTLSVGLVAAPRGSSCEAELEPWLAIQSDGAIKGIVEAKGKILETVKRNGEIHVVSWNEASWEATAGTFSALAIAADGSHREAVVPLEGLKVLEPTEYWSGVETFASNAHEKFGWRARRANQFVVATYTWNATKKQYVGSVDIKPAKPTNKKAPK